MRVAVVGGGPKALYAVERLLAHAAAAQVTLHVELLDPSPHPGAGAVWDPGQPDHLLLNNTAEAVDVWDVAGPPPVVPASERRAFPAWWAERGGDAHDPHPPRARVGAYLAHAFDLLRAHAPEWVSVRHVPRRVGAVEPCGDGWTLATGAGRRGPVDEVLIATGHAPPAPPATRPHRARHVGAVFPVDAMLSPDAVLPGSAVAVRGLALTFMDAVLTLTAGRGGRFVTVEGGLRYLPGGAEPRVVVAYSRTGRPMHARPTVPPAHMSAARRRALAAGRSALREIATPVRVADILGVVTGTADALLDTAHDAAPWMRDAMAGALPPDDDAAATMRRSLEVATGRREPGREWALGTAWRELYPEIVTRTGFGALTADDLPVWRRVAAEMERLAFGPPAATVARLLALHEAGLLDLRHAAGGVPADDGPVTVIRSRNGATAVDVVVDAVLAPPGASPHAPPVAGLVRAGTVRLLPGGRGLDVDRRGRCRAPDGRPVPGLSAIGRVTEDAVVGNDTLVRALHTVADAWAAGVVRQAVAEAGAPLVSR